MQVCFTQPKWLNNVKDFLKIRQIESMLLVQQKQRLIRRIEPFTLKNGNCTKWAKTIDAMMFDNNRSTNGDEKTT